MASRITFSADIASKRTQGRAARPIGAGAGTRAGASATGMSAKASSRVRSAMRGRH